MYRVMMVCTGNICRSPMAEIVLRAKLERAGIADRVVVTSSGISNEERGNPIDSRARRVLKASGCTDHALDTHSAQQLNESMMNANDLILTMTSRHADAARSLAQRSGADLSKVVMFRSFDPEVSGSVDEFQEADLDVEDPWYGSARDFETCLEQVEAATSGLVEFLALQD